MENHQAWAAEMRALLAQISPMEFGDEANGNELRPPAATVADGVPAQLLPMYRVFDGFDMPDVYNGYFVDTAARVATAVQRGMPTRIDGSTPRAIHVFGSDGGGSLFALSMDDGAVFYLQSDGVVEGGTFHESVNVRARRVAGDVNEFLELVLRDVQAFAAGDENHHYVID
jgi:hypothetical protein